jgi:hypothetical protein
MSVPLVVAGGGVQILGFGLALTLSVRTRREQSPGELSLLAWAWAHIWRIGVRVAGWTWRKVRRVLVRLHLMSPRTFSTSVNVQAGGVVSGKGTGIVSRRNSPMEVRVEHLEKDVQQLMNKQGEDREHLEGRIERVRGEMQSQQAEQQAERARQLGRRLRWEEVGIFVFVVGVGLTTWGALA